MSWEVLLKPCLAEPILDGTETGHIRDAERYGGGRGGGHLPPADGHTKPPEPPSRAGRRSRVKSECPGSRDAEPTRANPFALEARTAAACSPSAPSGDRVTAKGVVGLGIRRRPAEDGGVGAPPPAGRAEAPASPGTSSLSGFCTRASFRRITPTTWVNDEPLMTVGNRSAPIACGPDVDQGLAQSEVARVSFGSRTPLALRSSVPRTGRWTSPLRQDTSDERMSSWERNTDRRPNGPVEGSPQRTCRGFTKEFERDAVELVRSSGRAGARWASRSARVQGGQPWRPAASSES